MESISETNKERKQGSFKNTKKKKNLSAFVRLVERTQYNNMIKL